MTGLRYTVPLHPEQSVASFVSNLAANNGAPDLHTFSRHMKLHAGASPRPGGRTLNAEEHFDLERLGSLAGVEPRALSGRAIVRLGKNWAKIGKEKLRESDLAYGEFRHCPVCVRNEMEARTGVPEARASAPLWWMVKTIDSCPLHNVRLVSSTQVMDAERGDDFAYYFRSHIDEHADLYQGREQVSPSAVDDYQRERLKGERASPFLDSLPFYGAIELCEIVGGMAASETATFRRDLASDELLLSARKRGFQILHGGAERLTEIVHSNFIRLWNGRRSASRRVYGSLYVWATGKGNDQDFQPVRDLIEQHARANLPLGPADTFFFTTTDRQWHSVRTLADACSTHHTRIERILIDRGLTTADELKRTNARVLFDAQTVEALVTKFGEAITESTATELLGITALSFKQLVAAGYFVMRPLVGKDDVVRMRCLRTEVDAFHERIVRHAMPYDKLDKRLLGIYRTIADCRCTWRDLFDLLLDGMIDSLVYRSIPVLCELRMDPDEVRRKLDLRSKRSATRARVAISSGSDAEPESSLEPLS